jgi:hypothetical protein
MGPLLPEDCFEDEVYDPVDGVCYLACEVDDSCEAADTAFQRWLEAFAANLSGFIAGEEAPEYVLISYDVAGNRLTNPELGESYSRREDRLQADRAAHLEMWQEFTALIPASYRQDIAGFSVFIDGVEGTFAYVEPDEADPTRWVLALDIIDARDAEEQLHTLIHEFGHILTLNDRQVPFDEGAYYAEDDFEYQEIAAACRTYFTGEGCSEAHSYIYLFYVRFWPEIADEHAFIAPDDEEALYDFYEQYADQFVSDYAATDPTEDIAESWTQFVLHPKPAGMTIADQKVRFFYEFPELVELRRQILGRLYADARR